MSLVATNFTYSRDLSIPAWFSEHKEQSTSYQILETMREDRSTSLKHRNSLCRETCSAQESFAEI